MDVNPSAAGSTKVGPDPARPAEVRKLLLRYARPVVVTVWMAALVGLSIVALWCAGLTLLSLFDADHVFETEMDTRLRIVGQPPYIFQTPLWSWNAVMQRLTTLKVCVFDDSNASVHMSLHRGWFALAYRGKLPISGVLLVNVSVAQPLPPGVETRFAVPGIRSFARSWDKGLAISCWLVGLLAAALVIALARWRPRFGRIVRGACVGCGYDLTGNVSGRCPECGTAVAV